MNTTKTVALITGAYKGLGLETAKQLAQKGITVIITARRFSDASNATKKLNNPSIIPLELDVTHYDSIQKAFKTVQADFGKLDILINNAGIMKDPNWMSINASQVPLDILRETFEANYFGAIAVTQTFLPLIKKSAAGRIVNVSSILGSLNVHSQIEGDFAQIKPLAYDSSKAALNMFTIHLAAELRNTAVKVNSAHPGWVKTDMGGEQAPMVVEDGAKTMVELATLNSAGPTGGFYHLGESLPW